MNFFTQENINLVPSNLLISNFDSINKNNYNNNGLLKENNNFNGNFNHNIYKLLKNNNNILRFINKDNQHPISKYVNSHNKNNFNINYNNFNKDLNLSDTNINFLLNKFDFNNILSKLSLNNYKLLNFNNIHLSKELLSDSIKTRNYKIIKRILKKLNLCNPIVLEDFNNLNSTLLMDGSYL